MSHPLITCTGALEMFGSPNQTIFVNIYFVRLQPAYNRICCQNVKTPNVYKIGIVIKNAVRTRSVIQ